jgi:hypothetical protein
MISLPFNSIVGDELTQPHQGFGQDLRIDVAVAENGLRVKIGRVLALLIDGPLVQRVRHDAAELLAQALEFVFRTNICVLQSELVAMNRSLRGTAAVPHKFELSQTVPFVQEVLGGNSHNRQIYRKCCA